MASSDFNLLSSSSSSLIQGRYDVFVSFRGEDVRKDFADHLFAALHRNGIYAFRDDRNLQRGEVIRPELLRAIEESSVCIIILSPKYAESKWCLDELVKIMECNTVLGRVVIPVFYKVDPSDVRTQTASFEEDFAKHEEVFKDDFEKVDGWRDAMTQAAHLSGFHLQDKHETDFLKDIVKEIQSKLKLESSIATEKFVGIDNRLEELSQHINLEYRGVRFVGIHGMGGIGKTTLARVLYDRISKRFEGSCFLEDVRELSEKNQFVTLQEKILSQVLKESCFEVDNVHDGMCMMKGRLQHLKVLLVIDDVDHKDQLKYLVGNRDWFGSGSRIIVTTRDEHVLVVHGIDNIYKLGSFNDNEALQILSLNAFKTKNIPTDYKELCKDIIRHCGSHPLALKVVGSFLFGRSTDEWADALRRLREDSEKEVIDRLRISYDGLKETEKSIFLDIVFFFKRMDENITKDILESCGFHPNIGMKVLIERCLIYLSEKRLLSIHDLLEEMAKRIVRSESTRELGKRSRLYGVEAANVLMNNLGTETIEGIVHLFSPKNLVDITLNPKAFSSMKNLRVLTISHVKLPRGLTYLSNELRYLNWESYPLKSLPSSFEPENIVVLVLNNSNVVRQLWKGTKILNKLKYMDLDGCRKLTETPEFTYIPNLELLSLERCISLSKVHPSIGHLRKLKYIKLKDCKSLESLSDFISLESLVSLKLSGCLKLKNFPNIMGEMKYLKEVDIRKTAIKDFPCSNFLFMKNLEILRCEGCKGVSSTPQGLLSCFRLKPEEPAPFKLHSFSGLRSLKWLDLSYCNLGEGDVPSDLDCLSSLLILELDGNYFVNLPVRIDQLSNLVSLSLDNCKRLKSLPQLPPNTTCVSVRDCILLEASTRLLSSLPFIFNGMNCLKLVEEKSGSNLSFEIMKTYFETSTFLTCSRRPYYNPHGYPYIIKKEPTHIDLLFPGTEIPRWFTLQSEGNSMMLEKPTHSSHNVLLGFAICCVFSAQNWKTLLDLKTVIRSGGSRPKVDFLRLFVNDSFQQRIPYSDRMNDVECDHIWLLFFPINFLKLHGLKDCSKTKIIFTSHTAGVVVKQCAIRHVYKQDVKEFNDKKSDELYYAIVNHSSTGSHILRRDHNHVLGRRQITLKLSFFAMLYILIFTISYMCKIFYRLN